jgi:hypothetical protein
VRIELVCPPVKLGVHDVHAPTMQAWLAPHDVPSVSRTHVVVSASILGVPPQLAETQTGSVQVR